MTLLYDDKFAPITSSIGFIAADLERVAESYITWLSGLEGDKKLKLERLNGALDSALPRLLPLTTRGRNRSLLVATQNNWTAYFDNAVTGSDASPVVAHLASLLECRSVRMTAISDEREARRPKGKREAAVILEIFEAQQTDWLNLGRSITMMNDGRWIFELGGTQQPFEEPDNYAKQKVKDRFTVEMLDRYLAALGVRAFDPDFYLVDSGRGVLVEKSGALPKGAKEYTLEGSFARFG